MMLPRMQKVNLGDGHRNNILYEFVHLAELPKGAILSQSDSLQFIGLTEGEA